MYYYKKKSIPLLFHKFYIRPITPKLLNVPSKKKKKNSIEKILVYTIVSTNQLLKLDSLQNFASKLTLTYYIKCASKKIKKKKKSLDFVIPSKARPA